MSLAYRLFPFAVFSCWACLAAGADKPIDLSGYRADCAVRVEAWNGSLKIAWAMAEGETGEAMLDLSGERPLIRQLATRTGTGEPAVILTDVEPAWFLTVGER